MRVTFEDVKKNKAVITSYGKKSVVYLQQKKTADFFYFIHIPSSVMMIMDGC